MRNSLTYILALVIILVGFFAMRKSTQTLPQYYDDGLRIVSVSPNITEILFALELEDKLVGVTDFCDYPEPAKLKTVVGSIMEPDIETILKLNPTYVFVTNTSAHLSLAQRLRRIGLSVEEFDVDMIEGIIETINTIGEITHTNEKSKNLVDDIEISLEKVRDNAKRLQSRPKTLIVLQFEPLIAVGRNTYIDEVLQIAGGENAIPEGGKMFPAINAETLLTLAPDIIIETQINVEPKRDENVLARYKWNVPAVNRGDVFVIDADILSRPGPRIMQAAEQMQKIIFITQEDK